MRQGVCFVWLTIFLAGCTNAPPPPVGFVNQTLHSTAYLWQVWSAAQQSLASQVDLNPVQQRTQNAAPILLSGDPRALTVSPHQLMVAPQPDIASSIFLAATGVYRANPTGMIACPQPCNARYTTAYSKYRPALIRYAASWEFAGNSFETILQYEFENQILFALGYDMSWR
jgi:hypothetical protein